MVLLGPVLSVVPWDDIGELDGNADCYSTPLTCLTPLSKCLSDFPRVNGNEDLKPIQEA